MSQATGRTPFIDSPTNPRVRMLRDLHSASGRRDHGAFLVEGTRLVEEAVASGWPIIAAIFDESRLKRERDLASLVRSIPAALPASKEAIRHAADTVTPQGIVAAVKTPPQRPALDPQEPLVLVLDGIADPGNAGTLLRSALGAGVRSVLASRGSVDLFSPKVVRAGMGAHFRLSLAVDLPWPDIVSILGGDRLLVLAAGSGKTIYHAFDWRRPTALVVGSEAHGPTEEARSHATESVTIPLAPGLESLNAAMAGSIILFEAKRQRDR